MMSRNWFCCISKTHAKLKAECSDPLEAGMRKVHDQLHLAQCVSLCRSIKSPSTETRSLPLLGPPWDLPVSAPPGLSLGFAGLFLGLWCLGRLCSAPCTLGQQISDVYMPSFKFSMTLSVVVDLERRLSISCWKGKGTN